MMRESLPGRISPIEKLAPLASNGGMRPDIRPQDMQTPEIPEELENLVPRTNTSVEQKRWQSYQQSKLVVRKRATKGTAILLYSLATIFEIIQWTLDAFGVGLFANRIVTAIAALSYALIMHFKGLSMAKHWPLYKSLFTGIVIEIIPVLDLIPMWFRVSYRIMQTLKKEDADFNAAQQTQLTIKSRVQQINYRNLRDNA